MDSEFVLDGFRVCIRWIQSLYSMDSEFLLNGFRVFIRWIQSLIELFN